ncbi:MAG: hypothetical protein H8D54_00085 [Candidatus Omnitrophica bacterium]|nr:hypothetical protein [Candidatus Omnitrophota bacterium]
MNKPSKKQSISYNEGHGFKKEVEIQLIKYLGRLSPEIEMPVSARSINASSGLDVDIHITIKGKGLFANRGDIWVECKWKDNSPVRESDIQKLVIKAQDAFRYVTELGGFYYDTLIMVSNQDFDINALSYANALDVLCLRFYQGQLIEKNAPMNWVGDPAWMKQENN